MIVEYTNKKGQLRKWVLQAFVISGLRRMSYRAPMRAACLNKYRIKRGWYRCAECSGEFKKSQIAIDHILPVVPISGFEGFDSYITRLFCPSEGLQVLCSIDHLRKTKLENAERRKFKKEHKEKPDG